MRKKIYVKFDILTIPTFVDKATKVYGDVVVEKGRFAVDGKSLMGVLSLDTSTGVSIEYPDDAVDFEKFIKNFKAE